VTGIAWVSEGGITPAGATPALPLDAALELARGGGVREALDGLNRAMATMRRFAAREAWQAAVAAAREHPLREFVHRDPFTFRCFARPRGYCADGASLDYVLRRRELAVRASDPVAELHHYMTHGALARALLFRRDLVARLADEAAFRSQEPIRYLAAGCGHLRECDRMRALGEGRIAKLVAFDFDAENLECARRDYSFAPVVAHLGSVRKLIEGHHLFSDMHFVHSGGLVDSLPDAQAAELVRALFATLQPGGTLLVCGFLDALDDAGYVEAYMDWPVAWRTRESIEALASGIAEDSIERVTWFESPEATLGAIAIDRRAG
jgi:hypothetical protein